MSMYQEHVGVVNVRSVKVGRSRLEQGAHGGDVLVRQLSAAVEVGPEVAVLLFDPADADAKGQATAAEVVNGCGLLGGQQRVSAVEVRELRWPAGRVQFWRRGS